MGFSLGSSLRRFQIKQYRLITVLKKYKEELHIKMAAPSDERYVFIVEWFDTAASLVRTYNFTYFAVDNTIEMVISRTALSSSNNFLLSLL